MDDRIRNRYIANAVKGFRSSRGYSLDDLSKGSGVSRSMICQIEGEQTNPTISVLSKLATAMGVKLSELVDPQVKPTLYQLQCLKDAKTKNTSPDGSFLCSLLTEGSSNRHIEVFSFRFSKKGRYRSKGHGPRAIEYLFLTQGEMSVEIENEPIKMAAGDLLEFRASNTHTYVQESKNFAEGLSMVYFGV